MALKLQKIIATKTYKGFKLIKKLINNDIYKTK